MSLNRAMELKNVSFGYGSNTVLNDVSFTVYEGDYLVILGPNGGGKTTLLKLLLGILTPQSGQIKLLGKNAGEGLKRVGYMPQYTTVSETFPLTVRDAVLMGKISTGIKNFFGFNFRAADKNKAQDALEKVGMADFIDKRVSDLSGGQKQRVFIARALIDNPKMLILDEPTASVDEAGKSSLYCLLQELNKKMTVVMVSHDISVLGKGAKSVACVNGKVHLHDKPKLTREFIDEAYGVTDSGRCPVELVTHGDVPHRVLEFHDSIKNGDN